MMPQLQLSARDMDVLRTLKTQCEVNKTETFSADDIFLLQLDRFFPDKIHDIGAWCARMQHSKNIVCVGRKRSTRPSNHMRFIKLYSFPEKRKV